MPFLALILTVSVPSVWISGDVWHHSRWKPAGGRMRAYGWLPRGLLEKHSSQQLQPPQPCSNQAVHSHSALQHSPHLWRAGNKHKMKRKNLQGVKPTWFWGAIARYHMEIQNVTYLSMLWSVPSFMSISCQQHWKCKTGNEENPDYNDFDMWFVVSVERIFRLEGGAEISDVSAVTFSLKSNLL